ncbi:MAG TPA: SAM-dependent methyltransferase [Elusimicrobiota bacterium]|nr:SAM-dependent methyltransferase [Elusimicrobiota bacterium]
MSDKQAIENVSDTALWVAMYRAMETDRPDAHFRDPLARKLAGERGEAILRGLPDGKSAAWAMIVRTSVFDDMILKAVRERGVRRVVNLAAGLDSRPYRLDLPADLEWVEVDYPKMIDYKVEKIGAETPRCRLERVKLDLADLPARRALFDKLDAAGAPTLVITEGLLIYLTADAVVSLCDDLRARKSFRFWLFDWASPALLKMLSKRWSKSLERAEFKFAPADGVEFFTSRGWKVAEERVPADEARRLKREFPGAWFFHLIAPLMPARKREEFRRMSGYALLGR